MQAPELTLVLYPNYFGMGYVICENPKELLNYGMAKIRPFTTDRYIKRLHKYLKQYRPTLIILRGYENDDNRISKRTVGVINSFIQEAEAHDIPVYKYSRTQIKEVFSDFGGKSKFAIAKTIASWYPELEPRKPQFKRNSDLEDYNMGLFDAFSLMLTHHYLE
ncbi:hypothetical protein GCM10011344_26860 [Dokdonia pacifica]|uniref:Holliday junction resolvasome RuvABC endonuclease subunit n=1 Tax=Dokdonia pacifica TaxID=1627892 RepID=A0A239DZ68_9FLAO|nr:hypothetical protein [Dokdonia pacifica]GGG24841.1 hypothetical protein GCM10011344_26860 [Dokdonia pacifica]SNS37559.1 hypothetical protein SAMN06265376_11310 [Dokdonia pacifica]